MSENIKAVILAGGSSNRLWKPFCNEKLFTPKQFLKFFNKYSLLQNTLLRLSSIVSAGNTLVVTNTKFYAQAYKQIEEILPETQFLIETTGRNTAPAVACAVEFLHRCSNDDVVIIMPADHYIGDLPEFQNTIRKAVDLAEAGFIVTLGIPPGYPETGFGYIKTADAVGEGFKVRQFVEKPQLDVAEKYVASGKYFWNGGIFVGKLSAFLREFADHAPEILAKAQDCSFAKNVIDEEITGNMPFISIDHAVMEKSKNIALVKLTSPWSDLGTWNSVYQLGNKDANGNVVLGKASLHNVKNCLIYSPNRKVVLTNAENMVFANIDKITMACGLELF